MSDERDDSFLRRWSSRKHAARRGETLPEPERPAPQVDEAAAPPAPAPDAPAPAAELPSIDSLKGLESEYRDFLRPEVDPATRSAALKKLFGDPHFNQMDGLDVYIDDYTKADPIPNAVLRVLNQARTLGLFDEEEKKAEQTEPAAADAGSVPTAALDAPAETAAVPASPESQPAEPAPPKPSGA